MTTNKRYVQLLAMAQTGKKLESWSTDEDKKIYQEMKEVDKTMRRTAKKLGIKNPIMEITLEVEFWYLLNWQSI